MKYVLILTVALYLASLVFLVYATTASSRPSKSRQRGLEFGGYLLGIMVLMYFNVPSATVALLPGVGAAALALRPARGAAQTHRGGESNMIEYISTPVFSTFWGTVAMRSIIGLNALMAFLTLVTFRLRLPLWPLLAVLCLVYLLLNFYFPNATVAKFHARVPFPPVEALRLLITLAGPAIGFRAIHQALLTGKT